MPNIKKLIDKKKEEDDIKYLVTIFTQKQIEIIIKKLEKEKLTNSELVTFSKSIKPRLVAIIKLNNLAEVIL